MADLPDGTSKFKSPYIAVGCPTCGATVGHWCKRPSGHSGPMVAFHAARRKAATAIPRAWTTDEVREKFLDRVWAMVNYWSREATAAGGDVQGVMEGLAFSILSILDGGSLELPAFIVAPAPHPEDLEYHQGEGENWFPENHEIEERIAADIGGSLHELFYDARPRAVEE